MRGFLFSMSLTLMIIGFFYVHEKPDPDADCLRWELTLRRTFEKRTKTYIDVPTPVCTLRAKK